MRFISLVASITFALFSAQSLAIAEGFPQPANTEKATTQAMTPTEVCQTASLPPGFQLTTFAAEPDVQNPMAITTDARGRLWVVENYTWAGADVGNFDPKLRDRVVILEDNDGDGKFDKRKVFFDHAQRLTSVQVGMGGVWLLCPPQLLFVPDKNRDDVPDGAPEVMLDGFDLKASTHTVANGLKWGPDGWLYGRQGILGTSKIGVPHADDAHRVTMNTGVWRYHPTRHEVEVVMHGMTNPWGFDYDAFGECFVTNTVIGHLWHVIPGGRTERMFGSDFNPYAYQLISQTADHVHWDSKEVWTDVHKGVTDGTSAAGGGHAHTGLMIYQGDNWPEEYRGRAYTINLHGRRLNCDIFSRTPVGYVASHGPDMCFIADPWFRGMDVISGADGGVYLADWSDTGECHEIGGVHRTSGRIYKLTYGKVKANTEIDVAAASDQQLIEMQTNHNDWFGRRARLVLQERAATGTLDVAACRQRLLKLFDDVKDPIVRARAMWALPICGCVDEKWLIAQLHHPEEHVRVWAVRFLTDAHKGQDAANWQPVVKEFTSLASKDKSGLVLLYLASALQQIPLEARWLLGEALATRTEHTFAADRTLAIMLWLGMEPTIAQQPNESLALLNRTTFPLLQENIAHRFASEIDRDPHTVEQLLEIAAAEPKSRPEILQGVAAALNGRKSPPVPSNWNAVVGKLAAGAHRDSSDSLTIIGIAFKDPQTISALRQTLEDARQTPDHRIHALEQLLTAHPADLNNVLRSLVSDPDLALVAIRGLAAYDDAEAPAVILSAYAKLNAEQRIAAINTLSSRVNYAQRLLEALEAKRLQPGDISAFQARQLMALGNASISSRLQTIWGDIRQTSGERRKQIDSLRAMLTPAVAKADLPNGKIVFTKTCATCHTLFGQGAKIGPDLTGSNRKSLDYLLENIVDPSAVVAAEFRVNTLVLSDGHVLNGIVRDRNDNTITIETPDGKQVIDRTLVDEMSVSDKSLMPDGLLQPLNEAQVLDLIAYLMSNG